MIVREEIEEFAKVLSQVVRDATIRNCDRELNSDSRSLLAKRWHKTIERKLPSEQLLKEIIPDIVDDAIFHFLNAIDQGVLPLTFHASSGANINLNEEGDGELGGSYMGSEGWRSVFSQERINNDFADLV